MHSWSATHWPGNMASATEINNRETRLKTIHYALIYCQFCWSRLIQSLTIDLFIEVNKWQVLEIKLGLNSLWPSDAIWRQRSGSTLAQVTAFCLTAPSHYLNQCWLIIIWSPVTCIVGQNHKTCCNHQSLKSMWKLHISNFIQISQGTMNFKLHHVV